MVTYVSLHWRGISNHDIAFHNGVFQLRMPLDGWELISNASMYLFPKIISDTTRFDLSIYSIPKLLLWYDWRTVLPRIKDAP